MIRELKQNNEVISLLISPIITRTGYYQARKLKESDLWRTCIVPLWKWLDIPPELQHGSFPVCSKLLTKLPSHHYSNRLQYAKWNFSTQRWNLYIIEKKLERKLLKGTERRGNGIIIERTQIFNKLIFGNKHFPEETMKLWSLPRK